MQPLKHKTLYVLPPLKPLFKNNELQNHDRETQNAMSCSQATHYNTRTKAAALDVYQTDPESTSPVIANAVNCTTGSTHQMNFVPLPMFTHCCVLLLHMFHCYVYSNIDLYLFTLHCMIYIVFSFILICTFITGLYLLWLVRFDVCNFQPQILLLPRAIVTNVKCKLLCVIFYVLIFVFFGFVC